MDYNRSINIIVNKMVSSTLKKKKKGLVLNGFYSHMSLYFFWMKYVTYLYGEEKRLEDLWFHAALATRENGHRLFFNSSVLVILLSFTELIAFLSLMAFKYYTVQRPYPFHVP